MDFRNLCQKIDVDNIRAKIPPMPAMPAITMPQIKLPKSISKLKSRKIFRSSRENVNAAGSPKRASAQAAAPPITHADFINHTPKRISTISSLMTQSTGASNRSTYRRGCSVDDDYPTPTQHRGRVTRTISPVRAASLNAIDSPNRTASSNNVRMSLAEKLQKGYKDLSEFKLKHIFAKKTVVRKDSIQVGHYVARYEEDRKREELEREKHDREIADNYRFKFKISRQNTGHTNSLSSNDSPVTELKDRAVPCDKAGKSVSHESGDESGMEASPPQRKTGIAATRFSKMRKPSKSLSEELSSEGVEDLEEVSQVPAPIPSALWSTKMNRTPIETSPTAKADRKDTPTSAKGYRDRLRRLTNYVSSREESGAESEATSVGSKSMQKKRNAGKQIEKEVETGERRKRKAPLTPQQSEEADEHRPTTAENTLTAIKQNFKRFQKSMKRQQPSAEDSAEDEDVDKDAQTTKQPSKTEKIASRLRRFRSRDDIENVSPVQQEGPKSPKQYITNKLQTWKKTFKKKPSAADVDVQTGDETSPEKQKRSSTLIKKLKHIRTRKNPNSAEDLDIDEEVEATAGKDKQEGASRKASNLEEKFVQARQRTLKKVNEKMQNIKLFRRPQEQQHVEKENTKKSCSSDSEYDNEETNVPPTISRRCIQEDYEIDFDRDEIDDVVSFQQEYATRAVWTTEPILCDSMESDTDGECPRVLIHQDNSDKFESTLIIAVTRPATSSPRISEIPASPRKRETSSQKHTPTASPKPVEWIPNTEIISSFLEMTPPTKRKMSADDVLPAMRGHTRKLSVDSSSDSESWMPEGTTRNRPLSQSIELSRSTLLPGLNIIDENEEPWKVHTMFREEKLYKVKSIDIFEKNTKIDGAIAAFEDFDDELKNEPVLKISSVKDPISEPDSNEDVDTADDDNSSRRTKILMQIAEEEATELCAGSHTVAADIKQATQLKESQRRQFGNSRESLIANLDENDTEDESDRPPSAAPSPPPTTAPPPPPLPLRKSSIRVAEVKPRPPLPITNPPIHPSNPPPKVPERTASMSRIAKPLVKTSSLRLAYNEQVKPADVGKVNKLISRFEPHAKINERPRIIPRKKQQYDSEESSEEDDDDEEGDDQYSDQEEQFSEESVTCEQEAAHVKAKLVHDTTPTPTNTPKLNYNYRNSREAAQNTNIVLTTEHSSDAIEPPARITAMLRDVENNVEQQSKSEQKSPFTIPKISLNLDRNSNCSRPSSEYGSPLEYPSSLIGSSETTPVPDRREQEMLNIRRSRRSMTRDDERFFSFDSDEENSYYSISSTGSSRYVVEI